MRMSVALLCLLCMLLTGCASMQAIWDADEVSMGTQFEISSCSTLKIGFPGTVHGSASGEGVIKSEPVPAINLEE